MFNAKRIPIVLLPSTLAACLVILAGCTSSTNYNEPKKKEEEKSQTLSAEEVLEEFLKTYRNADSYADQATYSRKRAKRGEGVIREQVIHEMSLAVDKPDKLRFMTRQVYPKSASKISFDIAADGKIIRSAAGGLSGQVHEVPAPEKLTPENFIPELNIRKAALEVSLENIYPQLDIMLTNKNIKEVFPKAESFDVIDNEKLDGRVCHRVVLNSNDGQRILWIDAETYVLLRMELPIESQMAQLDPNSEFGQYAVWIDYNQPSLGTEIDPGIFVLEVPEGVVRVSQLVPPPPAGPPESLGKPVGEFSFTTLDGEEITPESVKGKVAVLDFWIKGCQYCQINTPILEKAYQEFKENDKFVFYAVNANLPKHNLSDEEVQDILISWGGTFPVLRDLKETSDFQMGIRSYPYTVILSPDGHVQFDESGEHTDPQPLIDLIQKLLDGGDQAAELIAEHQKLVDKFQSDLEEVTVREVESEASKETNVEN